MSLRMCQSELFEIGIVVIFIPGHPQGSYSLRTLVDPQGSSGTCFFNSLMMASLAKSGDLLRGYIVFCVRYTWTNRFQKFVAIRKVVC
jgi:hypothetical protein